MWFIGGFYVQIRDINFHCEDLFTLIDTCVLIWVFFEIIHCNEFLFILFSAFYQIRTHVSSNFTSS